MTDLTRWLHEASPYIQKHRDQVMVVVVPGECLTTDDKTDRLSRTARQLLQDLVLLQRLGIKLIVVHGARQQIVQALTTAGLDSNYSLGLRVASADHMPVIKQTIGAVRLQIESGMTLTETGQSDHACTVVGGNYITAKPYGIHQGVDFGYTGRVRRVQVQALQQQLALHNLVLLSPLGYSLNGEVYNLRAEDIATAIAAELSAYKLIFLIEQQGLTDDSGVLIEQMSVDQSQKYQQQMTDPHSTLTRDLQFAISAAEQGVERIHLISYQQPGALLEELFTRQGSGTLIEQGHYDVLRTATLDDIPAILRLIEPMQQQQMLVNRGQAELAQMIQQFVVIQQEGSIISCGAMVPYDDKSAELLCIVVDPEYTAKNIGRRLLSALEQRAKQLDLQSVFVLSTQTVSWFEEQGYQASDVSTLPAGRDYDQQRQSRVLVKKL